MWFGVCTHLKEKKLVHWEQDKYTWESLVLQCEKSGKQFEKVLLVTG